MLGSSTNWLKVSPIEVLITRACDPSLHEPNYAVHLEVAEFINTKKANSPREAAMLIARFSNHRNPHVAILALALLETLIQSCGYPFHLQISTKEFLNELVRRFPEKPPPFPGPVMTRILELINSWKEGICVDSRWREDLGNIRDMHRLLTFKGYRFRPVPPQQSLNAATNLKSAEELESEDREAQSAKLQELIRRGTPRDLAAAQELMKTLAGANPESKPDYRSQALTDLNKLEQKVILLNEMLDNVDTEKGEKFAAGDVYEQVASILSSARPKIQKWISDAETDDPESLDTFLQINDQINTVLNRYEAFKKGDYVTSSNPIPAELAADPPGKSDQSLIDFDESTSPKPTGGPSAQDELASLFGPGLAPSNPPIGLSSSAPRMFASPVPSNNFGMGMNASLVGGSAPRPMSMMQPSGTPPLQPQVGSIMLPGTPQPRFTIPNYMAGGPGVSGGMTSMVPQRPHSQPQQMPPRQQGSSVDIPTSQSQSQGKDPFADLAGLF